MCAPFRTFQLPQETNTVELAEKFAALITAGDTLLLSGPIGAGKSAFARAIIRARLGQGTDVPSPTFTIVQTYDDPVCEIWHCDLYRLTHPDEILELGLEEAFDQAICLIEWPDRLGADVPEKALHVTFAVTDSGHTAMIHANAIWAQRLEGLDD